MAGLDPAIQIVSSKDGRRRSGLLRGQSPPGWPGQARPWRKGRFQTIPDRA